MNMSRTLLRVSQGDGQANATPVACLDSLIFLDVLGCVCGGMSSEGIRVTFQMRTDSQPLTCADNTSILQVPTVVPSFTLVRTMRQVALASHTLHVVQHNLPGACPEVGPRGCRHGLATLQLVAHDCGLGQVPEVITHGPPCALDENLHSA